MPPGEPLSFTQEEVHLQGHAVECRINAENPEKNFLPCPGTIEEVHFPGGNGIRVDSAIYAGYRIPPQYDSMIAKVIAHGSSREEALEKLAGALEEFQLTGVDTNREYQLRLLHHPVFRAGKQDTSFIETYM